MKCNVDLSSTCTWRWEGRPKAKMLFTKNHRCAKSKQPFIGFHTISDSHTQTLILSTESLEKRIATLDLFISLLLLQFCRPCVLGQAMGWFVGEFCWWVLRWVCLGVCP